MGRQTPTAQSRARLPEPLHGGKSRHRRATPALGDRVRSTEVGGRGATDPDDCGSPLPPPGPSWAAEPLESRPGQGSILPRPHHVHFPKAVGGGVGAVHPEPTRRAGPGPCSAWHLDRSGLWVTVAPPRLIACAPHRVAAPVRARVWASAHPWEWELVHTCERSCTCECTCRCTIMSMCVRV